MGWASLSVAMRYVHPSDERIIEAISVLGGHNSGYSENSFKSSTLSNGQEIIENGERGRIRTCDPCLKRALLYQLSYAPSLRCKWLELQPLIYHGRCTGRRSWRTMSAQCGFEQLHCCFCLCVPHFDVMLASCCHVRMTECAEWSGRPRRVHPHFRSELRDLSKLFRMQGILRDDVTCLRHRS